LEYKITKIKTLDGIDKPDPAQRIGRVMVIDPNTIVIGRSFYMDCVEPGFFKSMITSPVASWEFKENGLRITTQNSIYELEEIKG
jgi:hypothetical protein